MGKLALMKTQVMGYSFPGPILMFISDDFRLTNVNASASNRNIATVKNSNLKCFICPNNQYARPNAQ
jgi:hypothetical protein